MRTHNAIIVLAALFGGSACTSLDAIPRGQCGNGVVEDGEYCDGKGHTDGECMLSGPFACHYECDFYIVDGQTERLTCPSGQSCGTDGVCRGSTGTFDAPLSYPWKKIRGLGVGDFDGDGRADLVTYSNAQTDIHYFNAAGDEEATYSIPGTPDQPSVASLDGALPGFLPTSDLLMITEDAVSGFLGQEDRTLQPVLFPAGSNFNQTIYRTVAIRPDAAKPQAGIVNFAKQFPDDSQVNPAKNQIGFVVFTPDVPNADPIPPIFIDEAGELTGEVAVGRLDPSIECESMVFMTTLDKGGTPTSKIHVYNACKGAGLGQWPEAIAYTLNFPSASEIAWEGVWITDVTGDGKADIVFGVSNATMPNKGRKLYRIEVSAGTDMNGNPVAVFDSPKELSVVTSMTTDELCMPELSMGEFKCQPDASGTTNTIAGKPLAVGDVTGDGYADIIDPLGILVWNPVVGMYHRDICIDRDPWSAAAIGQFNATPWPEPNPDPNAPKIQINDFVVGTALSSGLVVMSAIGSSTFNPYPITTDNFVREIAVGDFDGDFVSDFVIRQQKSPFDPEDFPGTGTCSLGQQDTQGNSHGVRNDLSILYGNVVGRPEDPVYLGSVQDANRMSSGRIMGRDGIEDLVVSAGTGGAAGTDNESYVFLGKSDRLFTASLLLFSENSVDSAKPLRPLRVITGSFTGAQSGDAVVISEEIRDMNVREYLLWLLKGIGKREFEAISGDGGGAPSDALKSLFFNEAGFFAFSLQLNAGGATAGGEAVDPMEIAFVGNGAGAQQKFWVISSKPPSSGSDAPTFELKEGVTVVGGKVTSPLVLPENDQPFDTPIRIADIDGDGLSDIVGITKNNEVVVFWNAGDGMIHTDAEPGGVSDPVSVYSFANGGASLSVVLQDIAVLNMDHDIAKELLVQVPDGAYRLDISNRVFETKAVWVSSVRGRNIVAGDFTGDGVDDCVIGGADGFSLLVGVEGPSLLSEVQ